MQSNVTVPASGSKFKLWLLIVVLAVAIFGGAAYGYYSWYKSNEPPPSLETVDGSGLQGMMKIQDGDLTGYRKIEAADAPDACVGTSVEIEKGTNYLYATSTVTFKDFYDAIAVKENVDTTFLFLFYSPGETVDKTVYKKVETNKEGFYFYPTDETKYKATHIGLDSGKDYSIPSYRSVVLYNDGKMKICGEKIEVALGKELTVAEEDSLFASLSPLPKGWVLVPFGWDYENVEALNDKLKDHVSSIWVKVGGENAKKVKDGNKSLISAEIETKATRSVWMNMNGLTDVAGIMKEKKDEGGDGTKDTVAPFISTVTYSEDKDSGRIDVIFSESFKSYSLGSICKAKDILSFECSEGAVNLVNSEGINVDDGGANVAINLGKKLEKNFYVISFDNLTDVAGNVAGHVVKAFEAVVVVGGGDCKLTSECSAGLVCAKGGTDNVSGKCMTSPCDLCKEGVCNTTPSDSVLVTCGAVEICGDKVDNDKNGKTDCDDKVCATDVICEGYVSPEMLTVATEKEECAGSSAGVGSTGVSFGKFKFTAGNDDDVNLSTIALKRDGAGGSCDDFSSVTMMINGEKYLGACEDDVAIFGAIGRVIPKGKSLEFEVKADIASDANLGGQNRFGIWSVMYSYLDVSGKKADATEKLDPIAYGCLVTTADTTEESLAKASEVCEIDADCETGLKCQNKGPTIGLVCGTPVKVGGSCFNKAVCEGGLVCVDKNNGGGFSCQKDACDVCGAGMICAKGDGDPVQVGCVVPVEGEVKAEEASVSVESAEEVCTDSRLGGNSEVVVHFDKEVSYNSASKAFDGWVFKVGAENSKTTFGASSVEYYGAHDKSSLLIGLDGTMLASTDYFVDVSKNGLAIAHGVGMPITACATQSTDFGIINVKQTSSSQVVVSFDSAVDAEMLNEIIDKIDLIEVDDIDVTRVGPGGGDPVSNDIISVKVVSGTDSRDVIITFADEIPDGMYQFQFTDSDAMKSVSGAAMRDVGSFFNFKGGFPSF